MIFDLHNDFPTALRRCDYGKFLSDCGNNTVTAVIWTSDYARDVALDTVNAVTDALNMSANGRALPIAIEDLGFLRGKEYCDFDFTKYIYCSLTWNYNNAFAGGALDDGELTDAGKRVIALMNGKCAVDLSHLNRNSFFSALSYAERPLCSHTGFGDHLRCLDDERIRALISADGIIGLCTVIAFTGAGSAVDYETVIDGFVQKYGVNNLALGTDFYGSKDIPKDLCDYDALERLKSGLSARGYDDASIQKIFFDNARKFFTEI